MPRASSVLCLSAVLALAASAHAIELPVIINGTEVAQAPKAPADKPSVQPPTIVNYPSAALQPAAGEAKKTDTKLPVIVNQPTAPKPAKDAPARVPVAYRVYYGNEYIAPVGYNAYGFGGPMLGGYGGGLGYMTSPYAGYYGGYGYGGYRLGYGGYSGYAPAYGLTSSWVDMRPPRVEVLDTGVRANIGRLTSMPAVASPIFGDVIGVYYR